ncbi:MAG: ChaN family lipoprotein [Deltaproteobacteria bacterium]|nr:ChaN family lipoprotein [Deltaproteobacteria bacterium]
MSGRPVVTRVRLAVVALATLLQGCATVSTTPSPPTATGVSAGVSDDTKALRRRPPVPPEAARVRPAPLTFVGDGAFAFVDGRTGAALSVDDVLARLRAHRVIVVGEQHDQAAHHEAQRRIVELVGGGGAGVVVGLEMLSWEKQEPLDRFNRGDVPLDALADVLDWKKAWGFDFGLYAPIFAAGKAAGARFVALNAPRHLVRAVREKGVAGLGPDDRARVPELDLGDDLHRAWFAGVFSSAGHAMKAADLDGFYRAQVLWDESMADGAVRALREGARQVVVIAGAGHVARGRGVPQRVERRLDGEPVLTFVPVTARADDAEAALARAIADGEGDVLVVPRFEHEVAL